jgi:hypothetical protein
MPSGRRQVDAQRDVTGFNGATKGDSENDDDFEGYNNGYKAGKDKVDDEANQGIAEEEEQLGGGGYGQLANDNDQEDFFSQMVVARCGGGVQC